MAFNYLSRRRVRRGWFLSLPAVALAVALAGCGGPAKAGETGDPSASAHSSQTSPAPVPPQSQTACPVRPRHFTCAMEANIRKVKRFLRTQPGVIGVVLYDRDTHATWANANADHRIPAASTIKLALTTDLLLRNAAGAIHLTPADQTLIDKMLFKSSDSAATSLWSAFESGSFLTRAQAFGMDNTIFTSSPPFWGNVYTTARDLDNLMNYVLGRLPTSMKSSITSRMQRVAPIEQWGVWGAGRANKPGVKDGWENDSDGPDGYWVTNTVGFAGPGKRYTLAIMDNLGSVPAGACGPVSDIACYKTGITTLSDIASLLFGGHATLHPQVLATP